MNPMNDSLTFSDLRDGSDAPPSPTGERRAEPRFACDRRVAVLPFGAERFVRARLVNCSKRGIGVRTHQAVEVGEQMLLKLREQGVTMLVYTVRNCRRDGDGFLVGAELSSYIDTPFNTADRSILRELVEAGPAAEGLI